MFSTFPHRYPERAANLLREMRELRECRVRFIPGNVLHTFHYWLFYTESCLINSRNIDNILFCRGMSVSEFLYDFYGIPFYNDRSRDRHEQIIDLYNDIIDRHSI